MDLGGLSEIWVGLSQTFTRGWEWIKENTVRDSEVIEVKQRWSVYTAEVQVSGGLLTDQERQMYLSLTDHEEIMKDYKERITKKWMLVIKTYNKNGILRKPR